MSASAWLPQHEALIIAPEFLAMSGRMRNRHGAIIKEIASEEAEVHHKNRIPDRFKRTAKNHIHHEERSPQYKMIKRRSTGSTTDLVHSGITKRTFRTYRRKRLGGSARVGGSNRVTATLVYRFPFPVSNQQIATPGVTPSDMADEIRSFAPSDPQKIVEGVDARYDKKMNVELKKRRRFHPKELRRASVYGG